MDQDQGSGKLAGTEARGRGWGGDGDRGRSESNGIGDRKKRKKEKKSKTNRKRQKKRGERKKEKIDDEGEFSPISAMDVPSVKHMHAPRIQHHLDIPKRYAMWVRVDVDSEFWIFRYFRIVVNGIRR